MSNIYIIGAGAAGFFLAITLREISPTTHVTLVERASQPLTKVRATGGGRCNVTNTFAHVDQLQEVYPRGARLMQRLFRTFSPSDVYEWWELHGVPLKVEDEGRVFPLSNTSDAIAQCLLDEAKRLGVELLINTSLQHFAPHPEGGFSLTLRKSGEDRVVRCKQLALTTGGAPHGEGFDALKASGHQLETPCPSLFNFRIADESLRQLSGITLDHVLLTLAGTKVRTEGSLLLTHQGISGPAALRLSAHGARLLAERNYRGEILISWLGTTDFDATLSLLKLMQSELSGKTLGATRPTFALLHDLLGLSPSDFGRGDEKVDYASSPLPQRLWQHLLQRAELPTDRRWSELGKKNFNRLATLLTADAYALVGRGTHKDEFVTCGGVSLSSVNAKTMESKSAPGLFFAGEMLDIDALTGGYNLTAAWVTAYVAAHGMAKQWEEKAE